jgi:hypothetical protein
LRGKTNRIGLYKCYACRKPFTVKIGTVFESSHVPMRVWLQAIYLFCSSKKGISTRQLQRTFQCGMKTAWFLGHRVREAMTELGITAPGPLGGARATRLSSAAKPQTAKVRSHPRRLFCRLWSAMAECAVSTSRT